MMNVLCEQPRRTSASRIRCENSTTFTMALHRQSYVVETEPDTRSCTSRSSTVSTTNSSVIIDPGEDKPDHMVMSSDDDDHPPNTKRHCGNEYHHLQRQKQRKPATNENMRRMESSVAAGPPTTRSFLIKDILSSGSESGSESSLSSPTKDFSTESNLSAAKPSSGASSFIRPWDSSGDQNAAAAAAAVVANQYLSQLNMASTFIQSLQQQYNALGALHHHPANTNNHHHPHQLALLAAHHNHHHHHHHHAPAHTTHHHHQSTVAAAAAAAAGGSANFRTLVPNHRRPRSADDDSERSERSESDSPGSPASGVHQSQQNGSANTGNGSSPLDALFEMTSKAFDRNNDSNDKSSDPSSDHLNLFSTRNAQIKKKRKSRTAFTNHQIFELEKRFLYQKYLSPADRDEIAQSLGLTNAQVITWFQNRRAKLKRDVEELKKDVDAAKLNGVPTSILENITDLNLLKKTDLVAALHQQHAAAAAAVVVQQQQQQQNQSTGIGHPLPAASLQ